MGKDLSQKYLDIAGVMFVAIGIDQKVTLINQKGCKILGCKAEDIIGKNWFDSFLPERLKKDVKNVYDKLMAGEINPSEYYENPVVNQKGEERLIAWHNTVLYDEDGKIAGTLSSGEDITERRKAEEELKKSNEELRAKVKELEIMNKAAVDRETTMIGLKNKIDKLEKELQGEN